MPDREHHNPTPDAVLDRLRGVLTERISACRAEVDEEANRAKLLPEGSQGRVSSDYIVALARVRVSTLTEILLTLDQIESGVGG
jgi:hypothetical protein